MYAPDAVTEEMPLSSLSMVVVEQGAIAASNLALKAYNRRLQPKELLMLKQGHFNTYTGESMRLDWPNKLDS